MGRQRAWPVICGLFIALSVTAVRGQEATSRVFSQVPPHARSQLQNRLDKYLQYEREERYAELYDLLDESHTAYLKKLGVKDRADYVRHRGLADVIIDFEPLSISVRESFPIGTYYIKGIVSSKWGSKVDKERGSIMAYLKRGTWYFAEIGVEIDDEQP